jgi:hypothetical protein
MLFRRKNNTLTPRCFHTDPSPPPSPRPPSPVTREPSGVRWEPGGDRGGDRVGTGGNRVGTAWEPGGNQVGARSGGSHWFPLGLHLGVSHAGGSKSEPGWGVGSKRGQTWSPRGPHWPNYVPTWFTRGPHMGPTWSPIGPHMVPTWSPLSPRGPRLVPARVSANRFTARFSHGSRMVPPLGGVVGASIA